MPRRGRRGYPAAILIGIDKNSVHIWLIYSESVRQVKKIEKSENGEKAAYRFHEEIVESIRALLSEGFNSIIVASEEKMKFALLFTEHVSKHHKWLKIKVNFSTFSGRVSTNNDIIQLIKNKKIQEIVRETDKINSVITLNQLERSLEVGELLYTIEEVGEALKQNMKFSKFFMTEKFYNENRSRRLFQSIIQISKNLGATVTIMKSTDPNVFKLNQLGGFLCVIKEKNNMD